MIVISDASPIIALHNIGHLGLLKDLYGELLVTDIVAKEINIDIPEWVGVVAAYDQSEFKYFLNILDAGEASSIALAKSKNAPLLIIDERKGRKIAAQEKIEIIGLIGVIVKAKKLRLIEKGTPILNLLVESGFRIFDKMIAIVKNKMDETD